MGGFIVAAPSSGSGKTTLTLGILRALTNRGIAVRAAKSGPDYIDPRFHEAACHAPCSNLDAWSMSPERIKSLAAGDTPLVIEGAMGLFDGAPPIGKGATADLARILGLPVILVVDASRMAQSIAPIARGFADHDPNIRVAGVILNNVGSPRHETMLRGALERAEVRVFGAVHRASSLSQPSRHLGLVQAQERPDLEAYLNLAADLIEQSVDLHDLLSLTRNSLPVASHQKAKPPAQRISVAQDAAFAFAYPHLLNDWREAGAEIRFFSPLANEAAPSADLIYLPGGYPELHAGRIAANSKFIDSIRSAADNIDIYGECGGYMVLGKTLRDAAGNSHNMVGLLQLDTSFATRKLHLGYREIIAENGPFKGRWNAHEFHYATTIRAEGAPLFNAQDAAGITLPAMGLIQGRTCGSFAHIIDAR